MEGTGKMLDYTAHMYSGQEHTSVKGRQANRQGKEYARHPPWLVLPDQASRPWRPPGQRDTEAMQSPGGGGSGGALPETLGQKYRLIYLSVHDHPLIGGWAYHRDCHVKPDLILIYRKPDATTLELVRLGSHSELGI